MVPMIVRVLCEDGVTDVPITPETTCFDVVECCRDPGDDLCALVQVWRNYERILHNEDRPLEILQEWGPQQDEVKFILRYTVLHRSNEFGESSITSNGMKEQGLLTDSLPDGVELSLWELQEMATRQQQQIESQHQILVAKEQRLRYLKHQEARTHQVAAENERLRRLKERVEAQELKLRKLRALRGQVDQDKINNGTLTSDLDSIRALFNEKEKELSLAVAKVEELTRQLEELKRNGRTKEAQPPASAALELDKLRRELLFRNKLKEQQNAQLNQQRDALTQRQEEINSIDKRITELQDRLQRKRLLNQQLANQLQYNNNNNNNNNNIHNNNNSNGNQMVRQVKSSSGLLSGYQGQRQNVAAVEPFIHVPNVYHQQTGNDLIKQNNVEDIKKGNGFQKPVPKPLLKDHHEEKIEGIKNENNKNKGIFIEGKEDIKSDNLKEDFGKIVGKDGKNKEVSGGDYVPEFSAGKSDPKYQTLPYNTKFGINYNKSLSLQNGIETRLEQGDGYLKNTGVVSPVGMQQQQPQQPQQPLTPQQQPLMTVHSTPILAPSLSSASRIPTHLNPRVYGHQIMSSTRGQPVGGTSPSSSTSSLATSTSSSSSSNIPKASYNSTQKGSNMFQQKVTGKSGKPVSSVAPTNIVQKSTPRNFLPSTEKSSPIYQTSSTKILPVQPQTLGSTPQGVLRELKGELSPPISTSTPLGTPELMEPRNKKPALPPKPAIPMKPTPPPPPRQAHPPECPEPVGYIEITPESLDQALAPKGNQKTDEVPLDGEPSRSPTPPPPPPPTTEPPDDFNSKRAEILESTTNDDKIDIKQTKANQSSNLVNSNYSGTHINVNNINNNININNNNNVVNNNNNVNNNHLHYQHNNNNNNINSHVSINRRIDIPPAFMIPETEAVPVELVQSTLNEGHDKYLTGGKYSGKNTDVEGKTVDEIDRVVTNGNEPYLISNKGTEEKEKKSEADEVEISKIKNNSDPQNKGSGESVSQQIVRRVRKGNLKSANNKGNGSRRVSFDPLALLLDASLEGELELVMKTASQVSNPSAANDEGITALHNAICAGHLEIVKFLVEFGCDVNAQDSDGWTPLHCAASCNNLAMVRFLVEHGACIFATTLSDHETAAEKCEEDEEGFDGCSEYLYSIQEKLGILNNGIVYAVYDYSAHNNDELSFSEGDRLVILRKGDEMEREWWWSRLQDKEGYTPRNLLGLYPRVQPNAKTE